MEEKKGKKSVRDLFFKLHFAWKKRELCDVHGGGGSSLRRPDTASCRRLTVSIFLVFVFFLFTISARQLYTPPLPPRTLHAQNIHHPHLHHSLPTLLSRPSTRAYCCTVYCGNNANGDCGTTGGSGGDSFLKVSFWFWRWQIHTILSSVVFRRPRTPIHIHAHTHGRSAVITTIASYFVCICVRMRRTTLFHLS